VDTVLPLSEMGALLAELTREVAGPTVPLPTEYTTEDLIAAQEFAVMETDIVTPGEASHISCPDCGGVLNEMKSGDELRFRCQIGHAFTPLGLADAQNGELERALAIAVRTHRDRIKLFTQMCENAERRNLPHAVARWREACNESEQMISVLEKATAALSKPPVADSEG
jgi:two-component system, chemotaxis family, protein-glutamate methylesterase/glutaminase